MVGEGVEGDLGGIKIWNYISTNNTHCFCTVFAKNKPNNKEEKMEWNGTNNMENHLHLWLTWKPILQDL